MLLDVCDDDQQHFGNALLSFVSSISNAIANVLGFVNWIAFAPFVGSNAAALFYLGSVAIFATAIISVLAAKELPAYELDKKRGTPKNKANGRHRKHGPNNGSSSSSSNNNFFYEQFDDTISPGASSPPYAVEQLDINASGSKKKKKRNGLLSCLSALARPFSRMNRVIASMLLVFFVTNAAYSPYMFYNTDFFGANIYHGDPTGSPAQRALYQEGVEMGSLVFALFNVVSALYSLVVDRLVRWFGPRLMHSLAHLLAAISFLLPLWPKADVLWVLVVLNAIAGIFSASLFTSVKALSDPFAIIIIL